MNELLRFLHFLSTAVWIGAAMWVAGDVRRTLALGRPHQEALAVRVGPQLGLDLVAGIATVVTGGALLLYVGGHPRLGIQLGLVLTLVRIAVVAALLRPAWRRVAGRIAAGETVPASDPAPRRMAMWSGIAHTLWVVTLGLMVFPI